LELAMKSASKISAPVRQIGVALLNLWISSLIPPGMVEAMRVGTLSIVHCVAVGACLLVPASSPIVPRLHVHHVRQVLVPLATALEPQLPTDVAVPEAVPSEAW
jgi:hypothetical protein